MGDFQAGTWFILLFAYFVFFILIVSAAQTIQEEIYSETIEGYDFSSFAGGKQCQDPRYFYDSDGDIKETNFFNKGSLRCDQSTGMVGEFECEAIEGCSWLNMTDVSTLYKIKCALFKSDEDCSSIPVCDGYINATYYNINMTTFLSVSKITLYDPYPDDGDTWYTNSPCMHPNVRGNQTTCEMFGCSWTTDEIEVPDNMRFVPYILNTVGDIFTFRYDFGIDNHLLSLLLNVIFVLIPLLMLLISIYFMLPIIH